MTKLSISYDAWVYTLSFFNNNNNKIHGHAPYGISHLVIPILSVFIAFHLVPGGTQVAPFTNMV